MIQSGGTIVIGTSITACLTTFEQALKNFELSHDQRSVFVAVSRTLLSNAVSDSETVTHNLALYLDKFSTPRLWRTLPVSQAVAVAQQFACLSCLPPLLGIDLDEEFFELSLYHTAYFCRTLPRDIRLAWVEVLIEQRLELQKSDSGAMTKQQNKRWKRPSFFITFLQLAIAIIEVEFAGDMFNETDETLESMTKTRRLQTVVHEIQLELEDHA
jgi:hypothetical protein